MVEVGDKSLPATGRLASIKRLPLWQFARWGGLFVFFLVAAIIQTWPLTLHLSDHIADSIQAPLPDIYYSLWNLVWIKQAFVDLQTNPFQTDYLFYPDGEHLYLHPLTVVNGLFTTPLLLITGNLFLSWNIFALVFFAFSGLAAYALAYRVTGNGWASIVAGYMFTFAPWVMMQFVGRWNISTVWPIPLFVLFLLRLLDEREAPPATVDDTSEQPWHRRILQFLRRHFDRRRIIDVLGAAVVWAVLVYNNPEYGLDAAFFLGLFLVFWSVVYLRQKHSDKLPGLWASVVAVGVVWLLIAGPLVIPAAQDSRSGEYFFPDQADLYSADLKAYVTPSPLWGPGEHPIPSFVPPGHDPVGSVEQALYLGGVPLLLATFAFFTIKKNPVRVLLWAFIGVVFFVLTLGPNIYVDGVKRLDIPTPYELYDLLPVFGNRRVPARMFPWVMLALSMLSAIGLTFILSTLKERVRLLVPIVAIVVFGLVILEYWNPPVYLSALPRPELLEQIRDDPGDFTVLDAPLGRRTGWSFNGHFEGANTQDYYAALHEKRTFGGFIGRTKESTLAWLRKEPGLRFLAFPFEPPQPDDLDPTAVRGVFNKYQIKYVILHRTGPHGQPIDQPGQLDKMDQYIRTVVGFTPIGSDPSLTVYQNPEIQ
jgi:hypothetical protein